MTHRFLPMLKKNCCALPAPVLAVASMKGKSYLSLGGVSMGIAGSIVDHNFFESWLGMKVQAVDMTELRRRIDQKILTKPNWKWHWLG